MTITVETQCYTPPPRKNENIKRFKNKVLTFGTETNVGEYRRGNQKWTIQRNLQHGVHKTKKNKTRKMSAIDRL